MKILFIFVNKMENISISSKYLSEYGMYGYVYPPEMEDIPQKFILLWDKLTKEDIEDFFRANRINLDIIPKRDSFDEAADKLIRTKGVLITMKVLDLINEFMPKEQQYVFTMGYGLHWMGFEDKCNIAPYNEICNDRDFWENWLLVNRNIPFDITREFDTAILRTMTFYDHKQINRAIDFYYKYYQSHPYSQDILSQVTENHLTMLIFSMLRVSSGNEDFLQELLGGDVPGYGNNLSILALLKDLIVKKDYPFVKHVKEHGLTLRINTVYSYEEMKSLLSLLFEKFDRFLYDNLLMIPQEIQHNHIARYMREHDIQDEEILSYLKSRNII